MTFRSCLECNHQTTVTDSKSESGVAICLRIADVMVNSANNGSIIVNTRRCDAERKGGIAAFLGITCGPDGKFFSDRKRNDY